MSCGLILSINTIITAVVVSVSIESPAGFVNKRILCHKTCVKICPAGQQRRQRYRIQTVRQELVYAGQAVGVVSPNPTSIHFSAV